eukprot:gene12815-14128_t
MFPHSKFNNAEQSNILRILREQERLADQKLMTYPLEKVEPVVRANALPPLGSTNATSYMMPAVVKALPSAPPLATTYSPPQRAAALRLQRKSSNELMQHETKQFAPEQPNFNGGQRKDFDACLHDAVRRHEEDKPFAKQRSFDSSDDSRIRKRMERPKSAHHGRRRPQTSAGRCAVTRNISLDD